MSRGFTPTFHGHLAHCFRVCFLIWYAYVYHFSPPPSLLVVRRLGVPAEGRAPHRDLLLHRALPPPPADVDAVPERRCVRQLLPGIDRDAEGLHPAVAE